MSELIVQKILPVGNDLKVVGKISLQDVNNNKIIDISPDSGEFQTNDFTLTHNELNIPIFILKDPSKFGFGYITDEATYNINKVNPNKGIKFHTLQDTLFNTFTIGNIQGGAGSITITPKDTNFPKVTESIAVHTDNFVVSTPGNFLPNNRLGEDGSFYTLIQTKNDEVYIGKSAQPNFSGSLDVAQDPWMRTISTFHPSSSYIRKGGTPIKTIFRGGGTYFNAGKHIFKGEVRIGLGTVKIRTADASITSTHISNHTDANLGPDAISETARGQFILRAGKASLPEGQTAQYWINQAGLGNLGPDAFSSTYQALAIETFQGSGEFVNPLQAEYWSHPNFAYSFPTFQTTDPSGTTYADINSYYNALYYDPAGADPTTYPVEIISSYVDLTSFSSINNALDLLYGGTSPLLTTTNPASTLFINANHIGRDNQPNLMSLGSFTLGLNSKADSSTPSFFEIIDGVNDVANYGSATKLFEVNNDTQQTFVTNLSSSGDLFASTSYSNGPENEGEETETQLKVVVTDSTGKFFHTGSYGGQQVESASHADNSISASYASSSTSASYADNVTSASYASSSTSASYALTSSHTTGNVISASHADNSISASYASQSTFAVTASHIENLDVATTYLELTDTSDTDFTSKNDFVPVVDENNSKLTLKQTVPSASVSINSDNATTAMSGGNASTNFHVPQGIDVLGNAFVSGNLNVSGAVGIGIALTIADVTISQSSNAFTFGSSSANTINHQMTGNLVLSASEGITANMPANTVGFHGTASHAESSSHALFASNSISASYASSSTSASYASSSTSASYATSSTSASYASSSTSASYAVTASYAINSDGSGFPFSGSAVITGSLLVSHSGIIVSGSGIEAVMEPNQVGFIGTASFAQTSSQALTASYVSQSISASYASSSTSASFALTASSITSDFTIPSASHADNSISASYASSSTSASHADNVISASYAATASHVDGIQISASHADNASSASYASSSTSASYASSSTSASHADNVSMLFTELIDVPSSSNENQNFYPESVGRYALQVNDGGNSLTFVEAVDSASYASSSNSASYAVTASHAFTASYASNVATSFIDLSDTEVTDNTFTGKGNYAVVVNNGGTKLVLETASLSSSYASSSTSASYASSSTSASYAATASSITSDFIVPSASHADNASSASYASSSTSASYASSSTSASFASTASSITSDFIIPSASYASSSTSASYASSSTSASYSLNSTSASHAENVMSASYASSSTSASYASTASSITSDFIVPSASYASSSTSASYASSSTSASHAITAVSGGTSNVEFHIVNNAYVSGNLNVSGSIGVADSVTIADVTISQSSEAFIFGSGSTTSIEHQMTGNLLITASTGITVTTDANTVGFHGTASHAETASHATIADDVSGTVTSASYASSSTSASYASSSTSASYALTASHLDGVELDSNGDVMSASYASSSTSASYASSSTSASFATTSSYTLTASFLDTPVISASYASSSTSASYASSSTSASYATSSTSASYALSSTSASYASSSTSASYASSSMSSSYALSSSHLESFLSMSDTPDTYLNVGLFGLQVNEDGDSIEFVKAVQSASYASSSTSASHALTASFALNTEDIPLNFFELQDTGDNVIEDNYPADHVVVANNGNQLVFTQTVNSASVAVSASYAENVISASHADNASSASYANNATSASHADNALTASYLDGTAISASYASSSTSASYASSSTSASYATSSTSASYASSSTSASYSVSASHADHAITASHALNTEGGVGFPFAGEAIITGSLEVINLWGTNPIQNNLTDNTYLTSSHTLAAGYNLYEAFDNIITDNLTDTAFYLNNVGAGNGDLHIDYDLYGKLGYSPIIDKIGLDFYNVGFSHKKVKISGSNNGSTWVGIGSELLESSEISRIFTFNNTTDFKWYRFTFEEDNFVGDDLSIKEISLYVKEATVTATAFTGSLHGNASSSTSASYASSSTSASYALTASFLDTPVISASYASSSTSASYASSSTSASYATSSTSASYASSSTSASYAATSSFVNMTYLELTDTPDGYTASFIPIVSANNLSMSFIQEVPSASLANTASYALTASFLDAPVISASYASSSTSASYASSSTSASHADHAITASFVDGDVVSASYASSSTSASYASSSTSASHAENVMSASYASSSTSASYALTSSHTIGPVISASHADNAISASYASSSTTASLAISGGSTANEFHVVNDLGVIGDINVSGSVAIGAGLTISDVQISSSANAFTFGTGSNNTITHQMTGNLSITASHGISFTGSANTVGFHGTASHAMTASHISSDFTVPSASYASSSTSASYASSSTSASYATSSTSASYALTASFLDAPVISASYASSSTSTSYATSSTSASHADNAISASYASSSTSASHAENTISASYASSSTSASYALTSSHTTGTVVSASHADNAISASYALTSSFGHFAMQASSSIHADSALSASYAATASHVDGLNVTTTYLELTDTSDTTFVDKARFVPIVKENTEDPELSTLVLVQEVPSASHAATASHVDNVTTTYLELTDTNATYDDFAHHVPLVTGEESGLKFFNTFSLFVESSSQSVNSNFSETASFSHNANTASYALTASHVEGSSTTADTALTAECANAAKVFLPSSMKYNLIMIEKDDATGVCAKIHEEGELVWDNEKERLGINDSDPVTKLDVNGIGFFRGRDEAYTVQGPTGLLGYTDPGIILNGRTGNAMYCEVGLHGISPLARMIKWDIEKMMLIIGDKQNDYIGDVLIQSGRPGGNILFYPGDATAGDAGNHVTISKAGYTSIKNKLSVGLHQNPTYTFEVVSNNPGSVLQPSKIRMRSTSISQYNFDIQQTDSTTNGVELLINATAIRPFTFKSYSGGTFKQHFKINNVTGHVVIGHDIGGTVASDTNYKLNVNGTLNAVLVYANGVQLISDKRLKTNIKDLDSQLGVIKKLKPRRFDWKKDQSSDIGFIAQELQKIVPESVIEAPDNEKTLHVAYDKLTPILVKAIQEQQKMIEKLSARIDELEK